MRILMLLFAVLISACTDRIEEARQNGYDEGYEEGMEEGKEQGKTEALDCVRNEDDDTTPTDAADNCE